VLSGVFFMLTLAAYVRYVRKPSLVSYLVVGLVFALGLMTKPMLVTVPFVLLLLDYWPLNRCRTSEVGSQSSNIEIGKFETQNFISLVLEKIPLLLFSAASCLVTIIVQRQVIGAMRQVNFLSRMINGLLSCLTYVYDMFWPARLAVFYPYSPGPVSIWLLAAAALVLCVITVGVFALRKRYPYLLTGWFWYLGMLVPVIGIIQVGGQARADRYTYLPHIGLYLAVTWAVSDLSSWWRHRRMILATGAVAAIIALAWCAHWQTSYWKNSESLWIRTLAVTSNNANAHNNLGSALLEKGRIVEAISHYQTAVKLDPAFSQAHRNFGRALFQQGDVDRAIMHWRKTLSIDPDDAEAHIGLGDGLMWKGSTGEAIAHYERSLQIESQPPAMLNDLAWLLSTCSDKRFRNGPRAVELAHQADELADGKNPTFIRTLAAAYAESGRFDEAIAAAQRALKLAQVKGDSALASKLQMDIDLYRMNFSLR
jgi:protein O-mannosyl-transferase